MIGHIEALYRYPVKSMAGERLEAADLGWHGIEGDRRLAVRKLEDRGGFPFLIASKLAELLLFTPVRHEDASEGALPSHVRMPGGQELAILGDELAAEIARRHGSPVQMMHMRQGIFDDASISVISGDTVQEVCRLASVPPDVRRFRPNILVRLQHEAAFQEDAWVGGELTFGAGEAAPSIAVTQRDVRCSMVNLDPDTARPAPEVMKAVVRANQNNAGVYGTVTRAGRLTVGQSIFLRFANASGR